MARVVLERVTKIFQGHGGEKIIALSDISLTVAEQELLVVVGPSGCGKTTLLRLIAGLEEPTSGTITMDDQLLNRIAPGKRDVAMVFQHPALYPHMSVYENMAFGLKLRKCSKLEIEQRVSEAADVLGLAHCLQRKPMALSGGQRQRVAIGRAIVRRPKLLLYDEPLSNLDPHMRNQMRLEISKLHQRLGATAIYVTHDQGEAMILGNRVAVLNQGVIHQVDKPLKLYRRPADMFVGAFFGVPVMNFFEGTLTRSGQQIVFVMEHGAKELKDVPARVPVQNGPGSGLGDFVDSKVILGIRPEHICPRLPAASSAPGEQRVAAVVNAVDCLGAETHLHLTRAGHEFVARTMSDDSVQPRKILELEFKMAQAHFFDPTSGKRIGSDYLS